MAAFRLLLVIGILTGLILADLVPADAEQVKTATSITAGTGVSGPRLGSALTAYNSSGLQKEVFAYAPYWALSSESSWNYRELSTVAYFGIPVNWDGTLDTNNSGWTGLQSVAFADMVKRAHSAGDRVLLVLKGTGTAAINDVVTVPSETQAVISATINILASKGLDGVNVDFEGNTDPTYPNIQSGLTNFMTQMSAQVHTWRANTFVTIASYSGSASWTGGLMRIDALAPVVDAFFIMAYDMSFSNMPGQAGPNAPLNGWTYNDTLSINQYLTQAPASKIILGVPWYGYQFNTNSNAAYAAASRADAVSYGGVMNQLACAPGMQQAWDSNAQSPYAVWFSPSSGDPCGDNRGSWQELYYDSVQSLGIKYDLINRSGIRGVGIWALGYDGGRSEVWDELNTYFSCPVTVTAAAPTNTTIGVTLSAGTCSVAWFEVQQYDDTMSTGWYPIKAAVAAPGAGQATAQGFPGYTYEIRARAHSTAGTVGAWSTVQVAVPSTATFSGAFKGLYSLDAYGGIAGNDSPPVGTSSYWPGYKIAAAARALPGADPRSGAIMDGFGGLHPYGATLTVSGAPYWPGFAIARDFAFMPDGSGGYVLDGYGGLHSFSANGHAAPPAATGNPYWPGIDVARKVVIFSDGTGGYILDAFGGLHPFAITGAVPALPTGGPYWAGFAIARDVVLIPGTHAGYVLDGFGGLHAFSGAPPLSSGAYWLGFDIARSVWLTAGSTMTQPSGYMLDGFGGSHPFGGSPALNNYPYWPGQDIARNLTGF